VIDDKQEDPAFVLPYAEPEVGNKIHIPTILVNEAEFKDITTAVQSHKSDIVSNEHEVLLSLNFPTIKRDRANVGFLLDISNKPSLDTMS
jgi:hypothetical protein